MLSSSLTLSQIEVFLSNISITDIIIISELRQANLTTLQSGYTRIIGNLSSTSQ